MTAHLSWDAINDYADDSLAPAARADAARHLDACAECREAVARVRALLADVASLPESVTPPAEVWTGIRATIDDGKVVPLASGLRPSASGSGYRVAGSGYRRVWLAAAAVVLVVASSAVTAIVMREGENQPVVASGRPGSDPTVQTVSLPAEIASVERTYLATVEDLTSVVNDPNTKLSPETIRAVQRSLKIIDDAIAEARQALLADPASSVLRDMLTKSYQQKVDLLRRATARMETE